MKLLLQTGLSLKRRWYRIHAVSCRVGSVESLLGDRSVARIVMTSAQDATSPLQSPSSGSRILTQLLALAQLLLGGFGFLGIFSYLTDDRSNLSRYQHLFAPAWAFIFAIPLLIISALLYRRFRARMMPVERWVFNIGCALPLVALGTAIAVSAVGW